LLLLFFLNCCCKICCPAVGVRIYNGESAVNVTLDMSDFMCKAVICKNLIVAVFSEILLC
jgi:hypothetical protein